MNRKNIMQHKAQRTPRWLALPAAIALAVAGCTAEDWDWFGGGSTSSDRQKPAPRAGGAPRERPAQPPRAAPQTAAAPRDAAPRDVDERIARYTETMRPESSYAYSDLNSKIQRQSDPERADRIRQTAARTRGDQPAFARDSSLEPSQEHATGAAMEPERRVPTTLIPHDDGVAHAVDAPRVVDAAPVRRVRLDDTARPVDSVRRDDTADRSDARTPQPTHSSDTSAYPPATEPPPTQSAFSEQPTAANVDEFDEDAVESPDEAGPTHAVEPPFFSDFSIDAPATGRLTDPDSPDTTADSSARTDPEVDPWSVAKASPARDDLHHRASPTQSDPHQPLSPPRQTAVDPFKARIVEQERIVARNPDNLEEQVRLRLMYLIDGQDDEATAPTPGLNEEIQEIILAQVRTLMAARGTSEHDPVSWANRQLDAIEDLRALIRARADLRVPRVEVCSAIDGFGRYEPIVPAQFTVGGRNQVIVYMEVDNFQTEKTESGLYRALMSVRASLLNNRGDEIWSMRDENIEDLARQRRSDFFLTIGPLAIPRTLGPGEYVMKVEVEDLIGDKLGSNFTKFKMVP